MQIGFGLLLLSLFAGVNPGKSTRDSHASARLAWFTALIGLGSLALAYSAISVLFLHSKEAYILLLPSPWGEAVIGYDPLSAYFGLIFALGGFLAALYGNGYLRKYSEKGIASHLLFLGLLIISLHLTLVVKHSVLFFFAWELMSLSSFFCILFEDEIPETRAAAIFYFIMMHIGAAFLLTGLGLAYVQTGSFDFEDYKQLQLMPALFLGLGFAFKAGFFPLYTWLPIAHPAAPSHVSGLMSGIMLKTGIYGLLLVFGMTHVSLTVLYLFAMISLVTAFLGIIHALVESDLKKVLAYSSIENIGIIGLGISFALLGQKTSHPVMAYLALAGALFHSLNHSIFKPLLFYLAGNIYQQTHTREIDILGGLQKRMPYTGALFLIGTLSISALPVFNGFISEFFIYLGLLDGFYHSNLIMNIGAILAAAGLALTGALVLFSFVRTYTLIFLGEPKTDHSSQAVEVRNSMLISPSILAVLCLLLGISAQPILLLLNPVISYLGFSTSVIQPYLHGLSLMQICFLVMIILATSLYLWRKSKSKVTHSPTWGCGYMAPNPKMQYNANSFIQPIAYFLLPFVKKKDEMHFDKAHFPDQFRFSVRVQDFIYEHLISPAYRIVYRSFGVFDRLQKGNTRIYILYNLIFLVVILIWVILVAK